MTIDTGTGQATWIATLVHHGQLDKAGQPYLIAHVADVVRRMPTDDFDGQVVAWLHDVLEDVEDNLAGSPSRNWEALIRRLYGDEIGDAVVAITHRPGEPRDDYYARVKANPIALRVKLADIASNTDPKRTALLGEATRERLARKYAHALEVLGVATDGERDKRLTDGGMRDYFDAQAAELVAELDGDRWR